MIKRCLLVIAGVLGGVAKAANPVALPPVTVQSGIWLERGRPQSAGVRGQELERLEAELRKIRAAQTGLIAELEQTQSRLLKTREADQDNRQLRENLEQTKKRLSTLSAELERLEMTAINKERTLLRQVDQANRALEDFIANKVNGSASPEVAQLKTQLDQLIRIRTGQEKERATLMRKMNDATHPDSGQDGVVEGLQKQIADIQKAREINNRVLIETRKKLDREQQIRSELEQQLASRPAKKLDGQEKALATEMKNVQSIRALKSKVDAELTRLRNELKAEKARVTELENLSKKHDTLKKQISELNSFIANSQDTQRIPREDTRILSVERESLKQLVEEFESKVNKQKGERGKQNPLIRHLQPEGPSKGAGISPLPNLEQAKQITALNEQLFQHKSLLGKAREEQGGLEARLLNTAGDLARSRKDLKTLESRLQEVMNTKPTKRTQPNPQLGAIMKQLEQRESELRKLASQESILARNQANQQVLEGRIDTLTEERNTLKERLRKQDEELSTLRDTRTEKAPAGTGEVRTKRDEVPTPAAGSPVESAIINTRPATQDRAKSEASVNPAAKTTATTKRLQPTGPIKPPGPAIKRETHPAVRQVLDRMIASANRKFKAGQTDEALREYSAALKLDPGHTRASLGLATAYYTLGRMDDAKRIVRATLDQDGQNPQALGLESIINWREGKHAIARGQIDSAIKLDPRDAMLHNYLGIIAHSMNDSEKAMTALNQAVTLDPFNAEVRFNLAVLLTREDKLDDARKNYEAAIKMGSRPDKRLENKIYK